MTVCKKMIALTSQQDFIYEFKIFQPAQCQSVKRIFEIFCGTVPYFSMNNLAVAVDTFVSVNTIPSVLLDIVHVNYSL